MYVITVTERLLLRSFTFNDEHLIYDLNKDPEVVRYTYDPIGNIEEAKIILEKNILTQYSLYNYGRWAVHLKHNLEFIGWCGLKYRPERNETDLGYRFKKESWGNGYATEAAKECIRYGFEKLNLETIVGRAIPGNTGSIHVLEKCGMVYKGIEEIEGYPHKTFSIQNPFIH
ncbi:MAG: GNAT family N-acetyltransferase [Bacteroidota bacterium]